MAGEADIPGFTAPVHRTLTEPIYRPVRRVLPDFGALDLSPLVVLLLLYILKLDHSA